MIAPLTGMQSLTLWSNSITGDITTLNLPLLKSLSLVGPMRGEVEEIKERMPMVEYVFLLGSGFTKSQDNNSSNTGLEQVLAAFVTAPPASEGGGKTEECADEAICSSLAGSAARCQEDSVLGERLREQCPQLCTLCDEAGGAAEGGTEVCEDLASVCSVAAPRLCDTEKIALDCPKSCGLCVSSGGRRKLFMQ